ncbi:MAG TPA: iron-sulfur cluster assembly protein [Bacteroidota bacterium]|nr:iron-sulfur cluster assembly protein [Bacteroidota bacterium]
MITVEHVYEALKECYDPEIPVNIVDLGLVYGVTIVDGWVGVKMTLTTPGCGMADAIVSKVRERILKIPGVNDGDVRLVWNPAWNPGLMSPSAKEQLGVK